MLCDREGPCDQESLALVPDLPLASWYTLGKSLYLPGLQFPHLWNALIPNLQHTEWSLKNILPALWAHKCWDDNSIRNSEEGQLSGGREVVRKAFMEEVSLGKMFSSCSHDSNPHPDSWWPFLIHQARRISHQGASDPLLALRRDTATSRNQQSLKPRSKLMETAPPRGHLGLSPL